MTRARSAANVASASQGDSPGALGYGIVTATFRPT